MTSKMRRIVMAYVMTGCLGEEPGKVDGSQECSDLRESIALACEEEAEDLAICHVAEDDCSEELEAANACATQATDDLDPSTMRDVAANLAYLCDINPWIDGACEHAQEDAEAMGVESCPLPEDF